MSKIIEKTKILNINGYEITISKLSIRKIAELLEELGKIPEAITGLDKMGDDELMQNLPMIIASSMPLFVDVIVKAVNDEKITREVLLDEFGIDDALLLIETLLEVNNVAVILERIKKVRALVGQESPKK